ncbi:hypothetical protein MRB53_028195 [Persea americana]|uniref:Uncharacterized protein n=1 Tax=Persea americana TaxID=3435 RepID=A0ACC2KF10_PERAE|nr:hypothetical protein MRB53_028195 [Persea americana]
MDNNPSEGGGHATEVRSSSSKGILFDGGAKRRTTVNRLARAGIMKCSLEGECSGGQERKSNSPTTIESAQGDSQDGEDGVGREDDYQLTLGDSGKDV